MTQADVDMVRDRCQVIAINDNYRRAPWAHYLYAADHKWWARHYHRAAAGFAGELWTQCPDAARLYDRLNWIESFALPGLSRDPSRIHQGSLSGYQAINLAFLWGARVILLLGYDMSGGHWFGAHPTGMTNVDPIKWLPVFDTINPAEYAIEIVNCSRRTELRHFPQMTIGQALATYT